MGSLAHARQHYLEQKGKEAHTHQTALVGTHSFWPGSTTGTPDGLPNYNWSAKTVQHIVYTEATFFKIGRDTYFI